MRRLPALVLVLAATGASAQKANPVLGVSLPLSGPRAEFANILKDGMHAAVESGTAAGTPVKLSLRIVDDKGDPDVYRANLKALAADPDVVAIGMCWSDASCEMASQAAAAGGLPLIGGISGIPLGTSRQGIFPLRGSYGDEVSAIVRHAETVGIKRLVLVNDAVNADLLQGVLQQARQGHVPLAAESLAAIRGRAQAGFDTEAYVIGTDATAAVKLIAALREIRPISQIYCLSTVAALDLARLMRHAAAGVTIAVHVPNPEVPSSELIREFLAAMEKSGAVNMLTHEQLEAYLATRVAQRAALASGSGSRHAFRIAMMANPAITISGYRVVLQSPPDSGRSRVTLTVISRTGILVH